MAQRAGAYLSALFLPVKSARRLVAHEDQIRSSASHLVLSLAGARRCCCHPPRLSWIRHVAVPLRVRYTRAVRPEDIAAFVRRDWAATAACKEAHWLAERRSRGVLWSIRVADELRRQVARVRPGWPTAEEREADLQTHVRVGEALRRVGRAGDR